MSSAERRGPVPLIFELHNKAFPVNITLYLSQDGQYPAAAAETASAPARL
jgi:hypothetical protein